MLPRVNMLFVAEPQLVAVSGAHRQMVATYRLSWTGGLEISPRAFQERIVDMNFSCKKF